MFQVNHTSLFVRIRKGWKELCEEIYKHGWDTFEVYVCTSADRHYAAEVWRLLDPDHRLIPAHQLKDRMLCVPLSVDVSGIPSQQHTTSLADIGMHQFAYVYAGMH